MNRFVITSNSLKIILTFFASLFFANIYADPINIIPEVIFQASNQAYSLVPTNSQVTIITQQQIKLMGAVNLQQVLKSAGGVQLQDLNGDGSQVVVSMRGFGTNASDNSLILVNGVPLVNPDVSTPALNMIPLHEIQQIEVFPGSEGVLFGDQAVGGVINIITKSPQKTSLYSQFSYGSYQTQIAEAGLSKKFNGPFAADINAKLYQSDNYRDHNVNDYQQITGQADYIYPQGKWLFDYFLEQQALEYAGALTAQQVAENRKQAQTDTNFFNNDLLFFHLQNQHHLNNNWQVTTDLSHRDEPGHGFLFSPFSQDQSTNLLQSKIQGLIHSALLTSGILLANGEYSLTGTMSAVSDNQQRIGAYAQLNIPLLTQLSLIIGSRAERLFNTLDDAEGLLSTTNSAVVTTLGLSYVPQPGLDFFVRRAGNFRFPKTDEIAFTPENIRGLKTQTGISYETGVTVKHSIWNSKLSLYQLDLNNEIAFDPTQLPSQPFGANCNLPPTTRQGAIFSWNYALTSQWLVGQQYTYTHAYFAEGSFAGKQIPFVASNVWQLFTDYQLNSYWDVYTEAVYTGSMYAANDDNNITGKIPGYILINANLRVRHKPYFIMFRVNNIFNKIYNSFTSYDPLSNQSFFYPAPGRNYLLTIGLDFQ